MPHPCFIPSIMQVLETGYNHQGWCEEGCSTVIIRPDPHKLYLSKHYNQAYNFNIPPNSQPHLMQTRYLRHIDVVENAEHFSYVVCFPDKDVSDQDESDTSTIFEEKRPKTSRGYPKPRLELSKGQDKYWSLASAARKLLPPKRTGSLLFKRAHQQH